MGPLYSRPRLRIRTCSKNPEFDLSEKYWIRIRPSYKKPDPDPTFINKSRSASDTQKKPYPTLVKIKQDPGSELIQITSIEQKFTITLKTK